MAFEAGTAFMQVVPSFAGVVDAITEEFARDGEIAGKAFKDAFEEAVRGATAKIDLDTGDADAKLAELDGEIDAVAARSPTIRPEVDGTPAIAELGAVEAAADGASGAGGSGGISGLADAAGGFGATAPLIGLAVTALIPLGGLAAGALATLPAILAGVATGAGAIFLALKPIEFVAKAAFDPFINALRPLVTNAILPGVAAGLKGMADAAGALAPIIVTIAGGIGQFVNWIGNLISQASSIGELEGIFNAGAGFLHDLQVAAAIFLDTLLTVGNQASPILGAIGQGVIDIAAAAARWVQNGGFENFLTWLKENGPAIVSDVSNFLKGVGKIVVALAPTGGVLLTVVGGLGKLLTYLAQTPAALAAASLAIGTFFTVVAIAADTNPIGAIITAIGLLLIGILELATHWDTVWNEIKETFDKVVTFLRSGLGTLVVLLATPIGTLLLIALHWQQIWSDMKKAVSDFVNFLTAVFVPVINAFKSTWDTVWGGVQSVAAVALDVLTVLLTIALIPIDILAQAIRGIYELFQIVWPFIAATVEVVWSIVEPIWLAMAAVVSAVFNTIVSVVSTAMGIVQAVISFGVGVVQAVWKGAWGTLAGAVSGIWGVIEFIVATGINTIASIINGIGKAIGGVADAIAGPFKTAFNAIKTAWNDTVGGFGVHIPGIFGFGGVNFTIPNMHTGGIVPGAPGTDVPIMMQAGELVIPRADVGRVTSTVSTSAGDARPNVVQNIAVTAFDPTTAAVATLQKAGFALKTRGY